MEIMIALQDQIPHAKREISVLITLQQRAERMHEKSSIISGCIHWCWDIDQAYTETTYLSCTSCFFKLVRPEFALFAVLWWRAVLNLWSCAQRDNIHGAKHSLLYARRDHSWISVARRLQYVIQIATDADCRNHTHACGRSCLDFFFKYVIHSDLCLDLLNHSSYIFLEFWGQNVCKYCKKKNKYSIIMRDSTHAEASVSVQSTVCFSASL